MGKGVAIALTVTLLMAGGYAQRRSEECGRPPSAISSHHVPVASDVPGDDTSVDPSVSPPVTLDRAGAVQRRDVYGNDITDAVATYKFDAAGSVYEEHSPETEVPRLQPPVT